jgi:hypothetical protein
MEVPPNHRLVIPNLNRNLPPSWGYQSTKEGVKIQNRSTNIITTNTKYTINPQSNVEETTLYYFKTLEVRKHHKMDPIMEGILFCSLASSRGHPPIELPLQIQYSLHIPLHCLNPFI